MATTIVDYASLLVAIADWLNRGDLSARLPDFVAAAEVDFNEQLRTMDMHARQTLAVSSEYTPVPTDWLETIDIRNQSANPTLPMRFVTPDDAQAMQTPLSGYDTGFFTMEGNSIVACPVPQSAINVELLYYQQIPALGTGQPSNWLLGKDPFIYLYGALTHAETYLQNDDRAARWAAEAGRRVEMRNRASEKARHSGQKLTARPRRHF